MAPLEAITYSFLFGLVHGILPDEHTWPITFSYAIGGASGRSGMKAGFYFSLAFTIQRMMISELANLALAPFLLSRDISGIVYLLVGAVMAGAGYIVLRRNRYPHLHPLQTHHEEPGEAEVLADPAARSSTPRSTPPVRWTLVHGFIAGFGFGGFSVFINTIAAPAMPRPWLGFLPGLVYGLGTMIVLVLIGGTLDFLLRRVRRLTLKEIQQLGARTGGRTLLFGGVLFAVAGLFTLLDRGGHLPVETGKLLIGVFLVFIFVPVMGYSWWEVRAGRGPGKVRRPNIRL